MSLCSLCGCSPAGAAVPHGGGWSPTVVFACVAACAAVVFGGLMPRLMFPQWWVSLSAHAAFRGHQPRSENFLLPAVLSAAVNAVLLACDINSHMHFMNFLWMLYFAVRCVAF